MPSATEKPAILPPPKITLPIRKRNEVILPPGVAHASRPSIPPLPPLPPFCASPSPPLAPTVSTEEEELEWAFLND